MIKLMKIQDFFAYAFKDRSTGEIVITYVGTEDATDAITDGEIGDII